jgi:hypothetical protein
MKAPNPMPIVKLSGKDGNAFVILGRVSQALKKYGADQEYINKYHKEAMMGDYNNLLAVTMKYVKVR